ncbi:MAG: type II toxin-antitoxin system VapC family toxin [Chroococcidiopsidaceae cyanobacterium CP_BM_ER_R8_30]|nr:type II toxin-antitoxin system VapC family toxin [Chroococcidiopsidaceae cyanobacterium CP_BM_ER_R8_30]
MKLLLDTHSFLWFIDGNFKLSINARMLIEDVSNQSMLSVASLWEMAIKVSIGKLSLDQPFETLIPREMSLNSIGLLEISFSHTAVVATLPFHHRDPFDRLLSS